MNPNLIALYYKIVTPSYLFRIIDDVVLSYLKDQIYQVNLYLNHSTLEELLVWNIVIYQLTLMDMFILQHTNSKL